MGEVPNYGSGYNKHEKNQVQSLLTENVLLP